MENMEHDIVAGGSVGGYGPYSYAKRLRIPNSSRPLQNLQAKPLIQLLPGPSNVVPCWVWHGVFG